MTQVFFKYNNKTVLLNLNANKNYTHFELSILGLEKVFRELDIDINFSNNPYKLINMVDFITSGRIMLGGKYLNKDSILSSEQLKNNTIQFMNTFHSRNKYFTKKQIEQIMKMNFTEI